MGPMAILAAAGGVMGAAGSLYEGRAAQEAAAFNIKVAKRNAYLVRKAAEEDARSTLITGRKVVGEMLANYGSSGIKTDEGSPLEIMQESVRAAEKDALNIRYQGELQARSYLDDAKMERFKGNVAETASYIRASSSLVSGGAEAYKLRRT